MDIHQVRYFLHLSETLNFTAAAHRSGVSQPSLTRAIRRLEEELGGALLYRDGKDSRLTPLGRDVRAEFLRIQSALKSVREHADNSAHGGRRMLDIAVSTTLGPSRFLPFIRKVLDELPTVAVNIHSVPFMDGAEEVLAGRLHACIFPQAPRPNPKLKVVPLFRERYLLACSVNHPLAVQDSVAAGELALYPFVDRPACEFHAQIMEHLTGANVLIESRMSAEREDWVQKAISDSDWISIIPEYSLVLPGVTTRPIEGMNFAREVVLVTVSGSGTPPEVREFANLAGEYDWLGEPLPQLSKL